MNKEANQVDSKSEKTQDYDVLTLLKALDELVSRAPEKVLGDGGSLYLNMAIPNYAIESNSPRYRECSGCPKKKNGTTNDDSSICPHRVYLVMTTREFALDKAGEIFYCTNPENYERAGEEISAFYEENLAKLKSGLKIDSKSRSNGLRDLISNQVENISGEIPVKTFEEACKKACSVFNTLFCTDKSEGKNRFSIITTAILSLVDPFVTLESECTFDKSANAYFRKIKKDLDSEDTLKFQKNDDSSAEHYSEDIHFKHKTAFENILRYLISMINETEKEFSINGILWEILKVHDFLIEICKEYDDFVDRTRKRYRSLGLSGWSVAFNVPVCLRRIDNPFELHDFPELIKKYKPEFKNVSLPVPLWGDRVRGHADRLERAGRPFLVVPVYGSSQNSDPLKKNNKKDAIGFIRIATKREGERYFTFNPKSPSENAILNESDDVSVLTEYSNFISKTMSKFEKHGIKASDFQHHFYEMLRLYAKVKCGDIKSMGEAVAEAFLESFDALATSVFLREDQWRVNEFKGGDQLRETKGSRFLLWGTALNINRTSAGNKAEITKKFENFKANVANPTFFYVEEEGKTGWAIKHCAALMALYENDKKSTSNKIKTLWLSKNQRVEFTEDQPALPKGTLPTDPINLKRLFNIFRTLGVDQEKWELELKHHNIFIVAPLIDPDVSPEPIGAIRLLLDVDDSKSQLKDKEGKLIEKYTGISQLSREFIRLFKRQQQMRSLTHTFTEMISKPLDTNDPGSEDADEHHNPSFEIVGDMIIAGPMQHAAASLIRISESSAVSIFIHNDFAPSDYQDPQPQEDTWVLIGSAASISSLSLDDQKHFKDHFCDEYFSRGKRRCRYMMKTGRTGKAIFKREPTDFRGDADDKSDYYCEIRNPSAILIIPVLEKGSGTFDKSRKVIAAVRFIRAADSKRAQFLEEEKLKLNQIVEIQQHIVKHWALSNSYKETQSLWKRQMKRSFPESLMKELIYILRIEYINENSDDQERLEICDEQLLNAWACRVPPNIFVQIDRAEIDPSKIKEYILAILGWFVKAKESRPDSSMVETVKKVIWALIRVQFGNLSDVLIANLQKLEKFEPALSLIPMYRDHFVHQFHVFLLGFVLMHRLNQKIENIQKNNSDNKVRVSFQSIIYKCLDANSIEKKHCDTMDSKEVLKKPDDEYVEINMAAWTLCALFHDYAYPIQKFEQWMAMLKMILFSADINDVNENPGSRLFQTIPRNVSNSLDQKIRILYTALYQHLKQANLPPYQSNFDLYAIGNLIHELYKKSDHGIWSSIVLLMSMDSKEAVEAASAIATHNNMVGKLKEWNLFLKVSNSATVLNFLLALCDVIHEWKRDIWNDDNTKENSDYFDPELVRINITDSQAGDGKKPLSKSKRMEIVIDISLGSVINGYDLDRKLEEIKKTCDVLKSERVLIKIRVSRLDPGKMAEEMLAEYSVNVDP